MFFAILQVACLFIGTANRVNFCKNSSLFKRFVSKKGSLTAVLVKPWPHQYGGLLVGSTSD